MTLDTCLEVHRKSGYEHIIFFANVPHVWIDAKSHGDSQLLKDKFSFAGVWPTVLWPNTYNYILSEYDNSLCSGQGMAYYTQCFELCRELEIHACVLSPGNPGFDVPYFRRWDAFQNALKMLYPKAKAAGVAILVSNDLENSGGLFNTKETLNMFLKQCDLAHCGVCLNLSQSMDFGERAADWFISFGEKLVMVGIEATRLGQPDVWNQICELQEAGYQGIYFLQNLPEKNPAKTDPQYYQKLKRLLINRGGST